MPGVVCKPKVGLGLYHSASVVNNLMAEDEDLPRAVLVGAGRLAYVRPFARTAASSKRLALAWGSAGVWLGWSRNL